jgi:hypothetical protein
MLKQFIALVGIVMSINAFAQGNTYETVQGRVAVAKAQVENTNWLFISQNEKDDTLRRWKNSRTILTQADIDKVMASPVVTEDERKSRIDAAQAELEVAVSAKEDFLENALLRVDAAKKNLAETNYLFVSQGEKEVILRRWKNSRAILTQANIDKVMASPIVTEDERKARIDAAQAELADALEVKRSIPLFTIVRLKIKNAFAQTSNDAYAEAQARVDAAKRQVANTNALFSSLEEKQATLSRWKNSRVTLTQADIDKVMAAPIVTEAERQIRIEAAQAELVAATQDKKDFVRDVVSRAALARQSLADTNWLFISQNEKDDTLRRWKNSRAILTQADIDKVMASPVVTEDERKSRIDAAQAELADALAAKDNLPMFTIAKMRIRQWIMPRQCSSLFGGLS